MCIGSEIPVLFPVHSAIRTVAIVRCRSAVYSGSVDGSGTWLSMPEIILTCVAVSLCAATSNLPVTSGMSTEMMFLSLNTSFVGHGGIPVVMRTRRTSVLINILCLIPVPQFRTGRGTNSVAVTVVTWECMLTIGVRKLRG